MPELWTGEVVGALHVEGIRHSELAKHMGITDRYLSMILNNKHTPPNAEQRVKCALHEMVEARHAESQAK